MATKQLEYNASVTYVDLLTPTLGIFRVVPDEPAPSFIPGQYAILGLNHEEKGGVMRPYSIASAPYQHSEYLEFYVRYVNEPTSDNPLTHLLFNVKEGDRIFMRPKLQGHFTEEKCMGNDDKRLRILVAAGTGLAPFTSMAFEHHHNHGNCDPYAIIHGASYPVDLGYKDILEEMMNKGEHSRYISTVSRPGEAQDWNGFTGRVESHFSPEKIEQLEVKLGLGQGGLNPENTTVMICGLQGTIANTIMDLFFRGFVPGDRRMRRALGVPADMPGSVFFEQYDSTPIIDINDAEIVKTLRDRLIEAGVKLDDIEAPAGS